MLKKKIVFLIFLSCHLTFVTSANTPQQTDDRPASWVNIPGKFIQATLAYWKPNPSLVVVTNDNKLQTLNSDLTTWTTLKTNVIHAALGADGTIGCIDDQKNAFLYVDQKWTQLPGSNFKQISIGNQNEIWAVQNDNTILRKKNDGSWNSFGKGVYLSCSGDSTVILTGSDQKLYRFNRNSCSWDELSRPANANAGNPLKTEVAASTHVVLLNFSQKAFVLIPGTTGANQGDWRPIKTEKPIVHASIGIDQTIAIVNQDNTLQVRLPSSQEIKDLEQEAGLPIHSGQIVRLISSPNVNSQRIWTNAESFYDPDGKVNPPNNLLELLVGSKNTDQDLGCFFSICDANKKKSTYPLEFGQSVEIYSLYAIAGVTSKSGNLNKDWKWSVHSPHFQKGQNFQDLVVSLPNYPGAQDGNQLFTLVSPCGKTGQIKRTDAVEIVHQSSGQRLWVSPGSRKGNDFNEIVTLRQGTTDPQEDPRYGARNKSGNQLFFIKPINSEEDLPYFGEKKPKLSARQQLIKSLSSTLTEDPTEPTPLTPEQLKDPNALKNYAAQKAKADAIKKVKSNSTVKKVTGNDTFKDSLNKFTAAKTAVTPTVEVQPQDIYNKINSLFFQDPLALGAPEPKSALAENHNDGWGLLTKIENQTDNILQIDGSDKLEPGSSKLDMSRFLFSPLTLTGYAYDDPIPEFGPEKAIDLKPMWSKGYGWMTESLETPGETTLQFIASAGDGGNIQVVFGRAISPDVDLKIIIGGWSNTKAAIIYKNQIIAETETSASPYASAMPGLFIPYWISIKNGFVTVGSGIQGTNITLSAFIPNLPAVDRIGFSTHETNVIYSQVSKSQALTPIAPESIYPATQNDLSLSSPTQPVALSYPLRVVNEGSLIFSAQPVLPLTINLSNANKDLYKISLQPDQNTAVSIKKNNKQVFVINGELPISADSEQSTQKYWFSINGGVLMMGLNNLGDEIFLAWEDQTPLTNISQVSFAGSKQTISEIQFSSPVTLGTQNTSNPYEKPLDRKDIKGSLAIIRAIGYDIVQDGQAVVLKDMVNGGIFQILATPQQKAKYPFEITIDPKGLPIPTASGAPIEDAEKIWLEQKATLIDKGADQIKKGATALFEASKVVGYALSNIVIFGIDAIGACISLALSGAGAGVWAAGAEVAAQASRARLEVKEGYRAHDSFVYTTQVTRDATGKVIIPQGAIDSKKSILQLLSQVNAVTSGKIKEEEDLSFVFHDEDDKDENQSNQEAIKTERLINLFNAIVVQITHPYITEDTSLKSNIIDGLTALTQAYQDYPFLYDECLQLFSRALANPLLLSDNNDQDKTTRDTWYQTFINLGLTLFTQAANDPTCPLTITPLQGEYLWYPGQFATSGKGWATFEVQGSSDLLICFAKDQSYVHKANNNVYECLLGAYDNTCHEFHIQSLGRPAAKYIPTKEAAMKSMLYPRRFKSFWINLEDGTLSLGIGNIVGKKGTELFTWKDPFPWQEIKYIGFSSWQTPIKIRNIKTSNVADHNEEAPEEEAPTE